MIAQNPKPYEAIHPLSWAEIYDQIRSLIVRGRFEDASELALEFDQKELWSLIGRGKHGEAVALANKLRDQARAEVDNG